MLATVSKLGCIFTHAHNKLEPSTNQRFLEGSGSKHVRFDGRFARRLQSLRDLLSDLDVCEGRGRVGWLAKFGISELNQRHRPPHPKPPDANAIEWLTHEKPMRRMLFAIGIHTGLRVDTLKRAIPLTFSKSKTIPRPLHTSVH